MNGGEIFISNIRVLSIDRLATAFKSYFKSSSENTSYCSKPGEKLFEELFTEQESPRTFKRQLLHN